MFGNKILSLIGVLFLSASVFADPPHLGKCSEEIEAIITTNTCTNNVTPGSYCLSTNGYIYGINGSSCESKLENGRYAFKNNANIAISAIVDTDIGSVTIYDCVNDECTQKFGYITNDNGYYSLSSDAVGAKVDVPLVVKCKNANIGELVKTLDGKVKLCLDDGIGAEFESTGTAKTYLMKNEANIFSSGAGDRIVLETKDNYFLFKDDVTDDKICKADDNTLVERSDDFCEGSVLDNLYNCEAGLCTVIEKYLDVGVHLVGNQVYECKKVTPAAGGGAGERKKREEEEYVHLTDVNCEALAFSGVKAFKTVEATEGTPAYETEADLANDTDPTKIKVYECQKGVCAAVDGFIKLNDNAYKCTASGCTATPLSSPGTCNSGSKGTITAYNSGFKFCTEEEGNTGNYVETTDVAALYTFVVNTDGNTILYISNYDGTKTPTVTVVGLSKLDGNYIAPEAGATDNDIYKCTSGDPVTCNKETGVTGYYLNSVIDPEDPKPLIYCAESTKCETIAPLAQGYYINGENGVIACNSVGCQDAASDKVATCVDNEGKILTGPPLKYCIDGDDAHVKDFSSSVKYYEFGQAIEKNIDYPTIFVDTTTGKKILLKVDEFSVTQETTNSSGICIKTNNELDGTCTDSGSTKYTCPQTEKCAVTPANSCDPTDPAKIEYCDGYYLVQIGTDANTGVQTETFIQNTSTTGATLYTCSGEEGNKSCIPATGSIKGYFKVKDPNYKKIVPFIKCTAEDACQGVAATTNDVCQTGTEGVDLVIKDDGTLIGDGICVNGASVTFTSNQDSQYFINTKDTNILEKATSSDSFVLVSVSEYAITLVEDHKYYYLYTFDDHELASKTSNVCSGKTEKLEEFKKDDENDTYTRKANGTF